MSEPENLSDRNEFAVLEKVAAAIDKLKPEEQSRVARYLMDRYHLRDKLPYGGRGPVGGIIE